MTFSEKPFFYFSNLKKYFINLKPEFYEDMEWLFEKAELAIKAEEVVKQALR